MKNPVDGFIKMNQKINYFVGPYGCGKTTMVKNLNYEYKSNWIHVEEDEDMIFFLKQPKILYMELFYLYTLFYKIKRAMTEAEIGYVNIIVDGHPLNALVYGRLFFEIEHGQTLSFPEWGMINKAHTQLYQYAYRSKMFDKYDQTIYYINIPYEENWNNIVKRGRTDMNEFDEWKLINLRRIMHQEIYSLADYYKCALKEVKSLEELNKVKFY